MKPTIIVPLFALLAAAVGVLVSYYPPPTNAAAIWALVSGFLGYAMRDLFAAPVPPQSSNSQSGRAAPLALGLLAAAALAGCGALNAYTGAALNAGEAGYTGARQNVKSADDMRFILWADSACALPLGALQRNATGNPNAVTAVLTACPVPDVGVIRATNGGVQVQITSPVPTAPYVAPAKP